MQASRGVPWSTLYLNVVSGNIGPNVGASSALVLVGVCMKNTTFFIFDL